MSQLAAAWPPDVIKTERLVLREPQAHDRPALIDLFSSPEVGTYIGGARSREQLEQGIPAEPKRRPGLLVAELDGTTIGIVTLDQLAAEHPHQVGAEVELGYMLLPQAWGFGYAAEACAGALDWFAGAFPGESVVLCTQTANDQSMRVAAKLGFAEVKRFEEYGAEQWLGIRGPR